MTTSPGVPERTSLPREFGEFLIELSLALNRIGMYPAGHPALAQAADALIARLDTLLIERPTLSLGVAKRQLVIEGVAAETENPVLRSLATRLHRHHIGAVVFQRGATADEVLDVLRLLAAEERGVLPLGLGDPARLRSWHNVRLYSLAYDQLELVGRGEGEEEAVKAAQLWVGLARAALATGDEAPAETEPSVVADAINRHPEAVAYDQVIVGYLLQIAGELQTESDAATTAPLRRRVSRLVSELSDDVRARLVTMGGDVEQRLRFLMDATAGFGGGAVVELVKSAAGASQQTVSHSMLRILTKLSTLADEGGGRMQEAADHALREQVRALVADWRLADPNPEAYTTALQNMASTGRRADGRDAAHYAAEPLRVVEMALEIDVISGHVDGAVDALVAGGGGTALLDVLESDATTGGAAGHIWGRLLDPERIGGWIRSGTADIDLVDRLMTRAPAAAFAGPLLDALASEEDRDRRLALLQRATTLGDAIAVEATARLRDQRWYVRRNMLHLLRQIGVPPASGALAHAQDPHPLVRREALQLALSLPAERERGLALALREADTGMLEVAVAEAARGLPPAVVPIVANRIADESLDSELRVALIGLLAATRSPLSAEALVRVASRGRSLLGRWRLAPRSPHMLAALRALAGLTSPPPHVQSILRRARRARDPAIRAAAESA